MTSPPNALSSVSRVAAISEPSANASTKARGDLATAAPTESLGPGGARADFGENEQRGGQAERLRRVHELPPASVA